MAEEKTLHEMENQVTKGAKSADPMPKAPNYVPDAGAVEDLGGSYSYEFQVYRRL